MTPKEQQVLDIINKLIELGYCNEDAQRAHKYGSIFGNKQRHGNELDTSRLEKENYVSFNPHMQLSISDKKVYESNIKSLNPVYFEIKNNLGKSEEVIYDPLTDQNVRVYNIKQFNFVLTDDFYDGVMNKLQKFTPTFVASFNTRQRTPQIDQFNSNAPITSPHSMIRAVKTNMLSPWELLRRKQSLSRKDELQKLRGNEQDTHKQQVYDTWIDALQSYSEGNNSWEQIGCSEDDLLHGDPVAITNQILQARAQAQAQAQKIQDLSLDPKKLLDLPKADPEVLRNILNNSVSDGTITSIRTNFKHSGDIKAAEKIIRSDGDIVAQVNKSPVDHDVMAKRYYIYCKIFNFIKGMQDLRNAFPHLSASFDRRDADAGISPRLLEGVNKKVSMKKLDPETSLDTEYIRALDSLDEGVEFEYGPDDRMDLDEAIDIQYYEEIPNYGASNRQYHIYKGIVAREVYAAVRKGDKEDYAFRISKAAAEGKTHIKYKKPRLDSDGNVVGLSDTNTYLDRSFVDTDDEGNFIGDALSYTPEPKKEEDTEVPEDSTKENDVKKDVKKNKDMKKEEPSKNKSFKLKDESLVESLSPEDAKTLEDVIKKSKDLTELTHALYKLMEYSMDLYAQAKEILQKSDPQKLDDTRNKIIDVIHTIMNEVIEKQEEEGDKSKVVEECLNRMDYRTDCEYNLKTLYNSLKLSRDCLDDLLQIIKLSDEEKVYDYLMHQMNPEQDHCTLLQRKSVKNYDGDPTSCSWYKDNVGGKYIIIIGNPDVYKPNNCDYDFVSDNYQDALDWFEEQGVYEKDSSCDDIDMYSIF